MTSSPYALVHTVLESQPLATLEEALQKVTRSRKRGFCFGLNGRGVVVTRAEMKSLLQEHIGKKSAAGRPPAPFAKETSKP